jgi:hypothetical protein
VERFQGGERTVVLVSATESDRGYLLALSELAPLEEPAAADLHDVPVGGGVVWAEGGCLGRTVDQANDLRMIQS